MKYRGDVVREVMAEIARKGAWDQYRDDPTYVRLKI